MSVTKYRSTVGDVQISGVDRNGAVHDPLVFKGKTTLEVSDDDGQLLDQTLKHALDAGTIELVPDKSAKE